MRKVFAVVVGVGLLLTGIASIGTAGASSRTASGTTPGVTAKEIALGIPYVDLSAIRSTINIGDIGDFPKMYDAIIADLNANGGINGRKVVPTYAPIDPRGTAPAQEACVKLTEDTKVFAVTGFFLGDATQCYVDQHATPVVGGSQTAERLAAAKAPWYSVEAGDEVAAQAIGAFVKEGAFKKGKVGVVVGVDAQGQYDTIIGPALAKNKVDATVGTITANQGDAVAAEQQSGVIAERFKSEGVKTVLVLGQSFLQFANALGKTDYRPRLLSPSETYFRSFVVNDGSNLDVVKDAIAANVAIDFNDPGLQKCFKVITKATGYTMQESVPTGADDFRQGAQIACRAIGLFTPLAEAAGKKLTVASFGKAADKAGSFEVPGSGTVTWDPKEKRFLLPVYVYRYDPATKSVVRDAQPVA